VRHRLKKPPEKTEGVQHAPALGEGFHFRGRFFPRLVEGKIPSSSARARRPALKADSRFGKNDRSAGLKLPGGDSAPARFENRISTIAAGSETGAPLSR